MSTQLWGLTEKNDPKPTPNDFTQASPQMTLSSPARPGGCARHHPGGCHLGISRQFLEMRPLSLSLSQHPPPHPTPPPKESDMGTCLCRCQFEKPKKECFQPH